MIENYSSEECREMFINSLLSHKFEPRQPYSEENYLYLIRELNELYDEVFLTHQVYESRIVFVIEVSQIFDNKSFSELVVIRREAGKKDFLKLSQILDQGQKSSFYFRSFCLEKASFVDLGSRFYNEFLSLYKTWKTEKFV